MNVPIAVRCVFVLATWSAVSLATDERVLSTARDLSEQGMADYDAGRYDEAAEKLQQVYVTVPLPSSARNAARAIAKQGKLLKAAQLFLECTRLQPNELWRADLQQTAKVECEQERAMLLARVARMSVVLRGANYGDVNITIDDMPVPAALNKAELLLDPGTHHIVAVRGAQTIAQDVELGEGQRVKANLAFESPRPSPTSLLVAPVYPMPSTPGEAQRRQHQSTLALVSGAIGVVGLGVGAGMVLVAEHIYSNAACSENNHCSRPGEDDRTRAIHTANWSMLPLGIGIAGIGTGLTLWFARPANGNHEHASAGLAIATNQLGVRGRF